MFSAELAQYCLTVAAHTELYLLQYIYIPIKAKNRNTSAIDCPLERPKQKRLTTNPAPLSTRYKQAFYYYNLPLVFDYVKGLNVNILTAGIKHFIFFDQMCSLEYVQQKAKLF